MLAVRLCWLFDRKVYRTLVSFAWPRRRANRRFVCSANEVWAWFATTLSLVVALCQPACKCAHGLDRTGQTQTSSCRQGLHCRLGLARVVQAQHSFPNIQAFFFGSQTWLMILRWTQGIEVRLGLRLILRKPVLAMPANFVLALFFFSRTIIGYTGRFTFAKDMQQIIMRLWKTEFSCWQMHAHKCNALTFTELQPSSALVGPL